jgi:hypothetical protein
MKKATFVGVLGMAALLALPSLVGTQDLKPGSSVDLTMTTACYQLLPFCDQLTVNIGPGGRISGWDDNCGYCSFQVGGQKTGRDFVLFLDFSIENCGAGYRYGLVVGTGVNGLLYRYYSDGTLNGPVEIQLLPCSLVTAGEATQGPASRAK